MRKVKIVTSQFSTGFNQMMKDLENDINSFLEENQDSELMNMETVRGGNGIIKGIYAMFRYNDKN